MGSDITYRCVSPLRFEITLKMVSGLRGISLENGGALTIVVLHLEILEHQH